MAYLLDRESVQREPTGAASRVLLLISQIVDQHGEPVPVDLLQWYVDVVDVDESDSLAGLREALGARPRRANLLTIVGDLVDLGLVSQEPGGLRLTSTGKELLVALGDAVGSFKSILV